MHRDQYLGTTSSATMNHVVGDFVDWLARNLNNTSLFTHEYTDRRNDCLLYTSPSPRDRQKSRMPSSA